MQDPAGIYHELLMLIFHKSVIKQKKQRKGKVGEREREKKDVKDFNYKMEI